MLKDNQLTVIIFALFVAVAAIYYIYPGEAVFYGSHTMYEMKNSSTYGYAEFCLECHSEIVKNITNAGAHNNTACICHGYNPNQTGGIYNVNLTHNLTKNAYCTNCHTRYDEDTGELNVSLGGTQVDVRNQSAHYIFLNKSNASSIEEVYNRSFKYFNRSFGPLPGVMG
jgi:hypothetical protein